MNSKYKPPTFTPLYFTDKLRIINPGGYVGIATLWSHPDWIYQQLVDHEINLSKETSPIAVIGTLYGNGLPELLRNLLYNPQITVLIIVGKDRSSSAQELKNFFELGLEEIDFLGQKRHRIRGTRRMIDGMVQRDMFLPPPRIFSAGELQAAENFETIREILASDDLAPLPETLPDRRKVDLPPVETNRFPSNPRSHTIVKDSPLDAWRELIFRLVRFGHTSHLRKGDRLELQNVKVIVEEPQFIAHEKLKEFGFEPEEFQIYYDHFIDAELPPGTTYTYGNRIGAYFDVNALAEVVQRLNKDPEDRAAYISLWDSSTDIASPTSHPCLVSLYFRRFDGKLTLTAAFRTHNSLDAWLKNFYGIMRVQVEACEKTGMEPGAITIISHSISVDTRRFDIAKSIADSKHFEVNLDPNGYFGITIDNDEIVVQHFYEGAPLEEYRGKSALIIQHQLYKNFALSDINHAMYLGRMLERAERSLKTGVPFVQD